MAEEIAVEDEKCGPEVDYRPYGGATSYAEIDAQREIQEYAMKVNMETYTLESLVTNITRDDEMNADQKATAIASAAEDYRKRINQIQSAAKAAEKTLSGSKSFFQKVKEFLDPESGEKRAYSSEQREDMAKNGQARPDGSYPIKDEADLKNAIRAWGRGGATAADKTHIMKRARALGKTDILPEGWKTLESEDTVELPPNRGFKVYRDLEGDLRWLSLSSNAFEDLDKELFTTKALEEAIEHADKTGERGPLLIYHVPSAEVGQCDYQAMAGRFLVESGTFLDTPLGRKAVEYFTNSDEEHQVSIGYEYRLGDEEDGIYEWTRIKERSVCPYGAAANPWTDFKVIGDNPMDARKVSALEKIFGKELAAGVISSAEERTKELEGTTRFKEVTPVVITLPELTAGTLEEMEATALKAVKEAFEKAKKPMTPEEEAQMKKDEAKKEGDPDPKPEPQPDPDPVPNFSGEQLTQLATLITDLTGQVEQLTGLSATVKQLQADVKALSVADDEKVSNIIAPRWQLPIQGTRPSESDKNLITDPEAVKALSSDENKPADPATAYVEQLLSGRAIASN